MNIEIQPFHVFFHFDLGIGQQLDQIQYLLQQILGKETQIMADLTSLETQVKANTDVEASAILLLQGLAAQLAAAATDPAKVQALADQLKASADNLAAAIVANTPAA